MTRIGEYVTAALVITVIGTGVYSCLPKKGEQSANSLPAATLSTPRMPEFHVNYNPTPAMKKIVDVAKKQISSKVVENGVDLNHYLIADIEIPGKEFSDKISYNILASVSCYSDYNGNLVKVNFSGYKEPIEKSGKQPFPASMRMNFHDRCFSISEEGFSDERIDGFLDKDDRKSIDDPIIDKTYSQILEILAKYLK
ncbi:MAG: hypothetical protein V1870_03000 [Candidatus Aenigmatarchaeota archaeon]